MKKILPLILSSFLSINIFSFSVKDSLAAVSGGAGVIQLSPETSSLDVGSSLDVSVNFDTGGEAISGISVRLEHEASEWDLDSFEINPDLLTGGWSCPIQPYETLSGGTILIDFACLYVSPSGYTSSGSTQLLTLTFQATSSPSPNPVLISFNNTETVMTRKSDAQDVLGIPSSSGTYTVNTSSTASPTPTATATSSSTTTSNDTSSGTSDASNSSSPTLPPDVPDSGSWELTASALASASILLLLAFLLVR